MKIPNDAQITAVNDSKYHAENSCNLVFDNERLYASLNGNLGIFDPMSLEWLGGDGEEVYGDYGPFDVDENMLWVWKRTSEKEGLVALDVTNPDQIEQSGFLAHEGSRVLAEQNFVYTLAGADCMRSYDVCKNPTLSIIDGNNPMQTAVLSNLSISGSIQNMIKTEDTLILYGEEIWLVDVSESTQPKLIDQLELPGYATDAVARDGLIYTTIGAGGLLILRMDESLQP